MTEPAQRECPAPPRDNPVGCITEHSVLEAVTALPWLAPSAEALAALARPPSPATWPAVRHDPGAVLLLLRCPPSSAEQLPFPHAQVLSPAGLDFAVRQLEQPPAGWVDDNPTFAAILDACRSLARLTHALARLSGRAEPERAWCAGLLAPLGWLAVGVTDDAIATACLADPARMGEPLLAQVRHWHTDHVALSRRLARRWELPAWLTDVIGHLDLSPDHAQRLGADPALAGLVRIAVHLLRERGIELGLASAVTPADEHATGLRLTELDPATLPWLDETPTATQRGDPYRQPLLRELLSVAADNRRLRQGSQLLRLEQETDELHALLREQTEGEAARLRQAKLAALAEFAAGAGHEINNPLAVISGQAQYLLGHQGDWFTADAEPVVEKALQTIISQTRRIHTILRDLMLFARPTPPRPDWFDLPTLMGEVAARLNELAGGKQVRLEVGARPERLAVLADAEQLRTALTCVLKNAIEAAPAEGWARLALAEPGPAGHIDLVIEDSGPGPTAQQRPHLFDPFYSGRAAGRGRGLGLPVAWRLARNQGGDLFLEPARAGAPTRFVLRLPRHTPQGESRSAA